MLAMYLSQQLANKLPPGIHMQGGLVCGINFRSAGHFQPATGKLGSGRYATLAGGVHAASVIANAIHPAACNIISVPYPAPATHGRARFPMLVIKPSRVEKQASASLTRRQTSR
jgi:hypothetical protein